jgi:3-oxocholest-4-en-26-oate---CoA ligase
VPGWNIAEVWEAVADSQPEAPATVQGDHRSTWADFDRRADGVAARLLAMPGAAHQAKVAQYLHNCPEYLESVFAAFQAGMVPVNTNYRYAEDELLYLWDNADAACVVFHGVFVPTIERIRERLPKVELWLWVDDGQGPCPDWAEPYEDAATSATERVVPPWGRDGDDLYILYTGGTTGQPKGTMWRQDDLFSVLNSAGMDPYPADGSPDDVRRTRSEKGRGYSVIPACPLMHGTGSLITFGLLFGGGAAVLLEDRHFDAVELWDTVEREQVDGVIIVGDAFARPMLRALDEHEGRWDLSSLKLIYSSGVMWSEQVKQGLLRHHSAMLLVDALGSSEAVGMGRSVSGGDQAARTASFKLESSAVVISDDNRIVEPGSEEIGRVAMRGRVPIGYYKDPEKSARTFPVIDGVRYSVPGDYATVEADGSITLLGRGSVVINTGGEKVFPEEVEEALKTFPGIRDAIAVGIPHETFGEAVTAVVAVEPGIELDEADVIAHVKGRLAHFKAPKRVLAVPSIERAANGKVDYGRWKREAAEAVGGS